MPIRLALAAAAAKAVKRPHNATLVVVLYSVCSIAAGGAAMAKSQCWDGGAPRLWVHCCHSGRLANACGWQGHRAGAGAEACAPELRAEKGSRAGSRAGSEFGDDASVGTASLGRRSSYGGDEDTFEELEDDPFEVAVEQVYEKR